MKERPILFSGPMVRAILAGTKTQTRRIVKPQPPSRWNHLHGAVFCSGEHERSGGCLGDAVLPCPYGVPGDRLWVRETWGEFGPTIDAEQDFRYRADGYQPPAGRVWRPSVHMPRWALRITLEITDVRVERLQDISEESARAEGAIGWSERLPGRWDCRGTARDAFRDLWQSINGPDSWDPNPWVWVISFRRIEA